MHWLLILPLFFVSCAHQSQQKKSAAKGAAFYFDRALYYKERGNLKKALENLTNLKRQFFYSSYNEKALLLTADIYFAENKFPEAAQTYEKYLNLYPNTKRDYVLYQIGLSYKKQLPRRAEHDLSQAESALRAFNGVLILKSNSPYKKKAQLEKQEVLNKKAEREFKAILFFKSQGWNQAGLTRVKNFIKNYPKSPLQPKALFIGFYLAKELHQDADTFKNALVKDYPNSKEAGEAQKYKASSSSFNRWIKKLL